MRIVYCLSPITLAQKQDTSQHAQIEVFMKISLCFLAQEGSTRDGPIVSA